MLEIFGLLVLCGCPHCRSSALVISTLEVLPTRQRSIKPARGNRRRRIFITIHPVQSNGQRSPDYPACRLIKYGFHCLHNSLRFLDKDCRGVQSLGRKTTSFQPKPLFLTRVVPEGRGEWLCGSIILPLNFLTDLPAQIKPQPEGPENSSVRLLPTGLLIIIGSPERDKPSWITRWVMEALYVNVHYHCKGP